MHWLSSRASMGGWIVLVGVGCSGAPPREAAPPSPAPESAAPGAEAEADAPAADAAGQTADDTAPPDATPPAEAEPEAAASPESNCTKAPTQPKDGVLFAHESSAVPKSEMGFLEEIASTVRDTTDRKICLEVLGSADPTEGGKASWMSGVRARNVAKELKRLGVPRDRIRKVMGYAAEDAASSEHACDDAARDAIRARNRAARVLEVPCK